MPIAEIIQIIDGISRKSKLKKELAGLADPNFRSGVDIYNQANSLSTGYSAQERNAFTQNLNRQPIRLMARYFSLTLRRRGR